MFVKVDEHVRKVDLRIGSDPVRHVLGLENSLTGDSAEAVLLRELVVILNVFPLVAGLLAE
jgi:hypothetical protein